MPLHRPRALAVLLFLFAPVVPAAAERLAVLEFTGADVQAKTRSAITDRARAAALEPVRRIGYEVMTRESTALVLEQMGGQCADGQCELEIARTVGAALVLTGETRQLEGEYFAELKLHDAAKGSLLAAEGYRGKDPIDLLQATPGATDRLLAAGLERYFAKPIPVMTRGVAWRRWYVSVQGAYPLETGAPIVFRSGSFESKGGFGARAGWRLTRSVAVELGAENRDFVAAEDVNGVTTSEISGTWITAGAAYHPLANRFFSVAADAGVARLSAMYATIDGTGDASVEAIRLAPTARAEVRLLAPVGGWLEAGAVATAVAMRISGGATVPAGMTHAGERWLEAGTLGVLSAGAMVRVSW